MGSLTDIRNKLEAFIRKYYTQQLIKGVLLFFSFGLLLFLLVTGVEFFLWLGSTARLVLLLFFIVAMVWLLYRYILTPILYLVKIKKGITDKEASKLIGTHFPEVGDRLLNLLELSEQSERSDIVLAAIEQRSVKLRSLPFTGAIDFKESFRYARFLVLPILVVALVWFSGKIADFFGSYNRVVNYDVAYEPPAPFQFVLMNDDLAVLENEPITVRVQTQGSSVPESVYMESNGERLLMSNTGGGAHQLTLSPPITETTFQFTANGYTSRGYDLTVTKVPAIVDFKMTMSYPSYLGLSNKEVSGTGNVTVPEGTHISWELESLNTNSIEFITADTTEVLSQSDTVFSFKKKVFSDLRYELATSNTALRMYERLGYRIEVIKDLSPEIKVEQTLDSLSPNAAYYAGEVSDDYLVREISVVYYESGKPDQAKRLKLVRPNSNVAQFYYTFPSGLEVQEGRAYEYYFEVKDNDGLRGGKIGRSQVFSNQLLDNKQLKNKELENQKGLINNLDKGLDKLQEQNEELEQINKDQKQQQSLEFNDKERIKQFLNQQKQQEEMMEKFSKELKETLKEKEERNEMSELLQERLERQEMEARKNQKLLDELEKVADKIEKEDLKKRLEDLAKSQNTGKRNLEQLLELTKRYYVSEKAAQLGQKLEKLAEEQEKLSESEVEKEEEIQEKLNKDFEELSKELDGLKGDNRALRKPMDIDVNTNKQEFIKKDQQDALENLKEEQSGDSENSAGKSSEKQKAASEKMKQISEGLEQSMMGGGGGSTIVEDAEMLRQILDNLITFSFKQEGLMERINNSDLEIGEFSSTVRKQKELRQLFEHVDDSLFALSLRRAELSEVVNEQITEVYYNTDKTLESIAENQMYQAVSYQQYVVNASNTLADFLADILDNMQESMMSGQGQGQGDGFQLPDIIKSQGDLKEKMEGAQGSSGKGQSEGEGEESQSGSEGDKQGEGQDGNAEGGGQNGQDGKGEEQNSKGAEGQNGKEKGDGETGKEGTGGSGLSESELKEIYEIYQEQQTIRERLEEQLKDIIQSEKRDLAKKLVLQMEQFENELLENGITRRTMNRMNQIQHQLLKLENAEMRQGKKEEREGETNLDIYKAPILTKPELLRTKNNNIEILNRQALPLRPNFKSKVKEYFGNDD